MYATLACEKRSDENASLRAFMSSFYFSLKREFAPSGKASDTEATEQIFAPDRASHSLAQASSTGLQEESR